MVGMSTFHHVCEALKEIKQSTDDWGGVAVLAVGDFYQLPLVGQSPVFIRPKIIRVPGDMAPPLWNDFMQHELDQVMHQKDRYFAEDLNRIHKKIRIRDSEDDMMLRSRELQILHTHKDYPCNAMPVYAHNEHCVHWNNIHLDAIDDTLYMCCSGHSKR